MYMYTVHTRTMYNVIVSYMCMYRVHVHDVDVPSIRAPEENRYQFMWQCSCLLLYTILFVWKEVLLNTHLSIIISDIL